MLKMRKAQMEDCKVIFDIRNDPQVRINSFMSEAIPYESHLKWFEQSMKMDSRKIFIVESEGKSAGVVRFDMNNVYSEATVSINIDTAYWGKGIGTFALNEGEKILKELFPSLKGIIAKVLPQNENSLKLFSKCQYTPRTVEFFKEVK